MQLCIAFNISNRLASSCRGALCTADELSWAENIIVTRKKEMQSCRSSMLLGFKRGRFNQNFSIRRPIALEVRSKRPKIERLRPEFALFRSKIRSYACDLTPPSRALGYSQTGARPP
jgi:phosphatidylinositol kinase/protein kinase (PI-3  family)